METPTNVRVEDNFTYNIYKCTSCGEEERVGCLDGDTVTGSSAFSEEEFPTISFYAGLNLFNCSRCRKQFYIINIDSVENRNVSEQWISDYFWHNSLKPLEITCRYTCHRKDDGLPRSWLQTHAQTEEGELISYYLGPFPVKSKLYGKHGVANCAGNPEWDDAKTIVLELFKLLSLYIPDERIPF